MSMNRPKWTFKMEGADTTDLWKELIGRTSRGYGKLAANQREYQAQAQRVLGGVLGPPVATAPMPQQGPPGPPAGFASTYVPGYASTPNEPPEGSWGMGPGAPMGNASPAGYPVGASTSGIPGDLWSSNIYSGAMAERGAPGVPGASAAPTGWEPGGMLSNMAELTDIPTPNAPTNPARMGSPAAAGGGGAAGPAAGPNDAWAAQQGVDMNWWNAFKAQPHPLGDQMLTGVDPVQYYMQGSGGSREAALARALKDAQWGAKFASTYGRPPTVDDWKYQWFTGNRQNQGANTVAEQNAYQIGLGTQYGVSPKPIVRK